eukprot:GEMP01038119.1.p1 GENE.GEMP01038119.1~~GEMP01038119.1.p1  ORF type:complete len:305 (+),score=48.17 GEMP01038119.1:71-985(+)
MGNRICCGRPTQAEPELMLVGLKKTTAAPIMIGPDIDPTKASRGPFVSCCVRLQESAYGGGSKGTAIPEARFATGAVDTFRTLKVIDDDEGDAMLGGRSAASSAHACTVNPKSAYTTIEDEHLIVDRATHRRSFISPVRTQFLRSGPLSRMSDGSRPRTSSSIFPTALDDPDTPGSRGSDEAWSSGSDEASITSSAYMEEMESHVRNRSTGVLPHPRAVLGGTNNKTQWHKLKYFTLHTYHQLCFVLYTQFLVLQRNAESGGMVEGRKFTRNAKLFRYAAFEKYSALQKPTAKPSYRRSYFDIF